MVIVGHIGYDVIHVNESKKGRFIAGSVVGRKPARGHQVDAQSVALAEGVAQEWLIIAQGWVYFAQGERRKGKTFRLIVL